MTRREEILQRTLQSPPLPIAAVKAIGLLQDSSVDLSAVARVIQHDPALAANVLRLANSSMFGRRGEIRTVEMALIWLGTRRVLDAVIGSAVRPVASPAVQGYDLPPGALWRHSVAVACGTEELAGLLGMAVPESAFTAGLLADIGKRVMGEHLQVDGRAIRECAFERGVPFEQAEREVLGVDHAEVGAALLEHWNLPEPIICVVRWHHEPESCPPEHDAVMCLVHAADQICTACGIGGGLDGCNYKPSEQVLQKLSIDTRLIQKTLCRIVDRLDFLHDMVDQSSGGS